MKTILHICDWYSPLGGAEKLLFDGLRLLEQAGHRNVMVYDARVGQAPTGQRTEYACKGLEPYWPSVLPGRKPLLIHRCRYRLRKIIDRHRPDVCHIHNLQNSYATEFLIDSLPTVRAIHDPRLYCFTWWRLLPNRQLCPHPLGHQCLEQGCLSPGSVPRTIHDILAPLVLRNYRVHRRMPVMIAESRMAIESLLENGYRPDQIAWLPNFTPLEPLEKVEQYVKQHYNPSERVVLFVGRASYEKGPQLLIQAAARLKTACKVVLITAGSELEALQRQAAPLGPRVQIIPGLPYDQTRVWYAKADVVVVPSVWLENFCLVGLEAYANRKPVIGSHIGGIRDWLVDGKTGWFFQMGNPDDLAEKIDQAMSDPQQTARMGLAAYQRAAEFYSAQQYLPRLMAIYQKAIDAFHSR
jgi:glycosyltransferase involved in cell wall biosynthesis